MPKWDPETEVKIEYFRQKRATGVFPKLGPLLLGGTLPASWVFFAPKMAQEPLFHPNLRQNCALSWPTSRILIPKLHQSCAKADQCHPQGLALILKGVGGSKRYMLMGCSSRVRPVHGTPCLDRALKHKASVKITSEKQLKTTHNHTSKSNLASHKRS